MMKQTTYNFTRAARLAAFTALGLNLAAIWTSAAAQTPLALHTEPWRAQQMAGWFDQALAATHRVRADIQLAKYPEDVPDYKDRAWRHAQLFNYYGEGHDKGMREFNTFSLAAAPCGDVLKRLVWPSPSDFAKQGKASLLAQLQRQADALQANRASCLLTTQHYFGYGRERHKAQILASFTDVQVQNGAYTVTLTTPVRTETVLLIGIQAPQSKALHHQTETHAQSLLSTLCTGKPSTALVMPAGEPKTNRQHNGWVSCGAGKASSSVAEALLRAGLAQIDYSNNVSASDKDNSSKYTAAVKEARHYKRGMWAVGENLN